ncbi:DUF2092 domain-containing protein [Shimia sp. SDUM112013]|uniref:DUF2092 domain-containing protein n=1 Tax=Shimia sp. SDUM112013 TaxID=3136160 RepID=UPI0032EB57F0
MSHLRKAATAGAVVLGLIGGLPAAAQTADPPDIDPRAAEIVDAAGAFLAEQDTVSLRWFVAYDDILDGREKLTRLRSGYSLLDREGGYFAYVEEGLNTRELYFNGTTLAIYDVEEDAYVQAHIAGGYDTLVDRAAQEYGLEIPIWSVLSTRYRDQYLRGAESATYLGLTRIGGQEAHHIALSNYDEDWQVWVATDEAAPHLLMLVGTNPYVQGWPQYRVYFSDWDFAPEIGEDTFTFAPGPDSERMTLPKPSAE